MNYNNSIDESHRYNVKQNKPDTKVYALVIQKQAKFLFKSR